MTEELLPCSGSRRRFWANRADGYKAWICIELLARVAKLNETPYFLQSVLRFVESPSHTAFRIDEVEPDGTRSRYAGGLIGGYQLPFTGELVFGIEAAWFLDDDPDAHAFIWQYLVTEAVAAGMKGLCVNAATVTHAPRSPERGKPDDGFGVFEGKKLLMAGPLDEAWSAFVRTPTRKPQFVDCLRVLPQVEINLRGVRYSHAAPLFRGEGRVNSGPYEGCGTLRAVAERAFSQGFGARGQGAFGGTCQEQILHQGYVSSPTVSLTAEFNVAVHYGTSSGQKDQALVFEIDSDRLRQAGPIWDSFATLTSHRSAWLQSDFDIAVKLVRGIGDLRESGALISSIDTAMRCFRADYEATRQGTSQDYRRYVGEGDWSRALAVLDEGELSQLCSVMENFFYWSESPEGVAAGSGYVAAFLIVRQALEQALHTAAGSQWQHPGWDNTVFGYFVKTCRDREFFSSGPISGNCIRQVHLVDRTGRTLEVYKPGGS